MRLTKKAVKVLATMGEIGKLAAEEVTALRTEVDQLRKRLTDAERPVRDQQVAIDRLKRRIHELETFEDQPTTMGR